VPASFLYSDTHGFHFMDEKSYEQFTFSADDVEPDRGYLKEGVSLQVLKYNGAPVSLTTPAICRAGCDFYGTGHARRHGRRRRASKQATLETGLAVDAAALY